MKNELCVIGVYFGKLRDDFPLWLKSCQWNQEVDYILFTDADVKKYIIPNNVYVKSSTLSLVSAMASKNLGYMVALNTPYKLCDFRPAYGIIFKEYIRDYKYWGHCDFDMMFGRISYFTTLYNIEKYLHFLTQGHLSFYKNCKATEDYIYLEGGRIDAKSVFTSDKNFAFDENYGIGKLYKLHNIPQFEKNIYADISPIYKRMRRSPYYKLDNKPVDHKYQLFVWENGRAYWMYINDNGNIEKEEMLYLHYQKRKLNINLDQFSEEDKIVFTPDAIIPWRNDITKDDIMKLNPPKSMHDKVDFAKWKLNKNYKRIKNKLKYIFHDFK